MRVEPAASEWEFGEVPPGAGDLVGLGADLAPGTLLAAYRQGLFPMHTRVRGRRALGWWSPDPRGVIPLDGLRVTRSLRRSCRDHRVTVDEAFDEVVAGCADPARPRGWIDDDIAEAYRRLHDLGWVHSVEAWTADGELAGGLYGVSVGALFAGESMFHRRRDGSKVALVGLVELLQRGGGQVLDVQWATDHLVSLGAVEVPRERYLALARAAAAAPVDPFAEVKTVWRGRAGEPDPSELGGSGE